MFGLSAVSPENLKTVIEAIKSYSLYITLALIFVLVLVGIILRKNEVRFSSYRKIAVGVGVGYAITLISVILFLQITRLNIKGETTLYYYLFIGLLAVAVLGAVSVLIVNKYKPQGTKIAVLGAVSVFIIYLVVLLCLLPTDGDTTPIYNDIFIILTLLLTATLLVLPFVKKQTPIASETRALSYAGVSIALSFALSYVKFFSLPQGGSVTLVSMLPLMVYAYIFGVKRGVLAGVIYGLLQLIQSPQIYAPLQVLLDYPLAFGGIGLAGIFGKEKSNNALRFIFGMAVACVFRYLCHVVSGTFVFHYGAPLLEAFVFSLTYNIFVLVDLVLDIIVGFILLKTPLLKTLDR